MNFGEKIKNERIKKNLTQKKLSDKIGVSTRTISNYENGNKFPKNKETYLRLAKVLDLDLNYLLIEDNGTESQNDLDDFAKIFVAYFSSEDIPKNKKDKLFKILQDIYYEENFK